MNKYLESKIASICVETLRNSQLLHADFALIVAILTLKEAHPELIEVPVIGTVIKPMILRYQRVAEPVHGK